MNVGVPNITQRATQGQLIAFDETLTAAGSSTDWTIMTASGTIVHDADLYPYTPLLALTYTDTTDYDWIFQKAGFYKGSLKLAMAASTFVTGGNRDFQIGVNRAADARCPVVTTRWLAADEVKELILPFAGTFSYGDALAPGTLFDTGSDVYGSLNAQLQLDYYRE